MDTSLIEVEYDELEKKHLIIENWIKMLLNRKWIIGDLNEYLEYAKNKLNDYDITSIKYQDKKYVIKLVLRKLNTIKNVDDIEDFINKYKKIYKFFVMSCAPTKVHKQLLEYESTEVFNDEELIINVVDNVLVPEHILLSDDDAKQYMKEYKLTKINLMKILSTDPIARYYNIKPGNIVKIIRPSITAGEEIGLRICV